MVSEAIGLTLKIVGLALDIFVKNQERREALKASLERFLKKSGKDSQESVDLYDEYEKMEEVDPWQESKNQKKP